MNHRESNSSRRDFFKITGGAFGIAALSYYLGLSGRFQSVASNDKLPDYIDNGLAFPVFRGPYLQKDVSLAAFLFQADIASLTTLCDQTLNAPEPAMYKYVPLMSSVILVYADMLISSLDERDSKVGLIPETEVSFWILTVAMQKMSTGYIPHHLAWYLPYLLVDESNAIATGREVYGFNKQAAEFVKPQEIQSPQFTIDVLGFKKFDPTAIAQKEHLLELKASSSEAGERKWGDWGTAKSAFTTEIMKHARTDLGSDVLGFAAKALVNNIPLVFLKQFRDAADTKKAAFKKIVEAPLHIKEYRDGAMLSQGHNLGINHLDSHPLAEKLGLKAQQNSMLNVWMKVDFILEHGVEI